ncbi:hypothetical protein [Arthrobacter sp. Soil762]|uniref:hypothetical protein n=1 Tax=Arthrobacter sp. Soil762 TaxID=1736401 RepID=UPI000AE73437|nr:hypothetical protein [Arthrobacter sp. Soil762]
MKKFIVLAIAGLLLTGCAPVEKVQEEPTGFNDKQYKECVADKTLRYIIKYGNDEYSKYEHKVDKSIAESCTKLVILGEK